MFARQYTRQRKSFNAGNNSPIPNRTLGSSRSRMDGHLAAQSPGPTHMSNHPPVTPYAPFRAPFGSISPSPFASPFVERLATPFKKYTRRFSRYTPHANASYGIMGGSMPPTSEEQLDLQAALVVYCCGLIFALFLFWTSATIQSTVLSSLVWFGSVVVFLLAMTGFIGDIYSCIIVPKLHEVQSSIASFKMASYFPFLLAPTAPIGVINTPPRKMQHGRMSRGSPAKMAGMNVSRMSTHTPNDDGRGSHRHDAYLRPPNVVFPRDQFYSPNRARNDQIIKDSYGRIVQDNDAGSVTSGPAQPSTGFLGGVSAFLFGNTPTRPNGRSGGGPPTGNATGFLTSVRETGGIAGRSKEGPLLNATRASLPHSQGTPVGAAFAASFSPIPAKSAPNASPWVNGVGTGASKLFSPMSLDSARVNSSMASNFSFMGLGDSDAQMDLQPTHQRYPSSAPLSPRRQAGQNLFGGMGGYSQSVNASSFYQDHGPRRGVLQPIASGQNEVSRFDGGGLTQRYGSSYRHHTEQKKKRPSLTEHVESAVELYRGLGIDDKMHNWAESMRWWLVNKVIKPQTEDWSVNDVNVNELFQFICEKFPENRNQLSNFQSAAKRGEFFLANVPQVTEMSHSLKAPQIIEIVQKRQHIVNAMKKISGSSRFLDYLQNRLKFLSSCTNPAEIKWNGGGKEWESGVLPTDSQLMMSMFGQFMDDYLCPAVEFTQKYLIKCDLFPHEEQMDDMVRKHCRGGFSDVAIVEVGHHVFGDTKYVGPYYFVIFDKQKHPNAAERERANAGRNHRRVGQHASRSSSSLKFGAWYPQPGASNMIQSLTLFAFFVHEHMNDEIAGRNLRGQQMFVDSLQQYR